MKRSAVSYQLSAIHNPERKNAVRISAFAIRHLTAHSLLVTIHNSGSLKAES
jgi:hypothetical protein